MELTGIRTIITGGSRGIGRAIAIALAKEQGCIGINYVNNDQAAEDTAREVKALGGKPLLLQGDVSKKEDAERIVGAFVESFGGIDSLINNAGSGAPGTILTLTDEQWLRAIEVHLNGAFYCTRAAAPHMVQQKSGRILLMSSVAGLRGAPNTLVYGMVKAGLLAFTRATAVDLAPYGITVNALCPGLIDTDFHAATTPERREYNTQVRVPLKRYGTADEVADAALALIRNDYITGEALTIDGGLTMRIA